MLQSIARNIQLSLHYLMFLRRARNRRGHGIHSPYVFHFVNEIVYDRMFYPEYRVLDAVRRRLRADATPIRMTDLGAPSYRFKQPVRRVKDMLKSSSIRTRYGRLFFRIARQYGPGTMVELGTSVGYSSLFLAMGNPGGSLISLEGNPDLWQYARSLFRQQRLENIIALQGLFDELLPTLSREYPTPQLVFIDGNHDYEPTLNYFRHFCEQMDEGILLFDDIYWSANMRRAWKEIVASPEATVTIDFFFLGVVLRKQGITPGHYRVPF